MRSAADLLPQLRPGRARDFDRALDSAARNGRLPNDEELASLVGLARELPTALAAGAGAPRPEFRAALRERLLAAAEAQPAAPVTITRRRPLDVEPRRTPHRGRRIAAGVVALALTGGVATAAVSSNAQPGDALYPVKRGIEHFHLGLMQDDASRGQEQLAEAETRLTELRGLVSGPRAGTPDVTTLAEQTFADLRSSAETGSTNLVRAYSVEGSTIPLRELDNDLSTLSEGLRDLVPLLPPSLRAPARTLADQLGSVDGHVHQMLSACTAPCDTIPRTGAASTLPSIDLPFAAAAGSGTSFAPGSSGLGGGSSGSSGLLPTGLLTGGTDVAGAGGTLPGLGGVAGGVAANGSTTGGTNAAVGGVLGGVASAGGGVLSSAGGAVGSAGGAVSSAVGGATSGVGGVVTSATSILPPLAPTAQASSSTATTLVPLPTTLPGLPTTSTSLGLGGLAADATSAVSDPTGLLGGLGQ